MQFYTEKYDEALDKIPLYQRYAVLKPFVGSEYGTHHPKILLIAESHYLPPESTIHLDSDSWYHGSESLLNDSEKKWMRTRRILNKQLGDWSPKGHTIYRRMEKALIEAGLPAGDSVYRQVAFMNAFQRPAVSGESIQSRRKDIQVAVETVSGVINALKPDHILFVSTKARKQVGKRLEIPSDGVCHPASPWWYRKRQNENAKDRFTRLIASYLNEKD